MLLSVSLSGKNNELDTSLCNKGNFALPSSQRPGPLVSFGENVLHRNQAQLSLFGADAFSTRSHFFLTVPGILYGISDDLSLFFNVPIAVSYEADDAKSSGLGDLFFQLEYALYARESSCSSDQVTFVVNVSFPTGSSHKNPPTGFGAVAYFVGATYNRMWVDWFCFTSYGAEVPMSHDGMQFGNEYLYQFGFGQNILNTKNWMLAWMLEIDGTFAERNKIHGVMDPNSGGNVIYATPSFWASTRSWTLQLGLGYAIQQNLFGNQPRAAYLLAFLVRRTF